MKITDSTILGAVYFAVLAVGGATCTFVAVVSLDMLQVKSILRLNQYSV